VPYNLAVEHALTALHCVETTAPIHRLEIVCGPRSAHGQTKTSRLEVVINVLSANRNDLDFGIAGCASSSAPLGQGKMFARDISVKLKLIVCPSRPDNLGVFYLGINGRLNSWRKHISSLYECLTVICRVCISPRHQFWHPRECQSSVGRWRGQREAKPSKAKPSRTCCMRYSMLSTVLALVSGDRRTVGGMQLLASWSWINRHFDAAANGTLWLHSLALNGQ
jgi:hypothetical protein